MKKRARPAVRKCFEERKKVEFRDCSCLFDNHNHNNDSNDRILNSQPGKYLLTKNVPLLLYL